MTEVDVPRSRWRARTVPLRLRSDERLARHAARGDAGAFAALYERHHRALYRYCRSIVGDPDDAADALQNTMVRALAAIGARDERAPVRAWLFRIAHNEAISTIRSRRSGQSLDPDSLIGPDVEADAEQRRRLAELVTDLHALSERQRGALLMRELSGLGHAEIAAALDVSEGAVKQTIYEGRTALHDFAAGREMACAAVRRELSDGDGRTARSRRLRAHLRSCEACRAFRSELRVRRSKLAAITPVLPAATAAAVLEAVIGGGGAGGGGLLAGLLGGSGISKTVAIGAATVTAGAGAVTFTAVAPEVVPPDRPAAEAPRGPDGPPPAAAAVTAQDEARDEPVAAPDPQRAEPQAQERLVTARPQPLAERGDGGSEERGPQPRPLPPAEREDDEDVEHDEDEGSDDDGDEDERRGPSPPVEPDGEHEDEDDEHEEEDEPEVIPASEPDLPEPDDDEDHEPDDD